MQNGVLDKAADATILTGVGVATFFGLSIAELNQYLQGVLTVVTIFAVAGAGWYHWSRVRIINRKKREEGNDPPEEDGP